MAKKTNFDDIQVNALSARDGKTFPKGTPAANIPAASAITAATTDTTAAKLTDVQALQAKYNLLLAACKTFGIVTPD